MRIHDNILIFRGVWSGRRDSQAWCGSGARVRGIAVNRTAFGNRARAAGQRKRKGKYPNIYIPFYNFDYFENICPSSHTDKRQTLKDCVCKCEHALHLKA